MFMVLSGRTNSYEIIVTVSCEIRLKLTQMYIIIQEILNMNIYLGLLFSRNWFKYTIQAAVVILHYTVLQSKVHTQSALFLLISCEASISDSWRSLKEWQLKGYRTEQILWLFTSMKVCIGIKLYILLNQMVI